MKNACPRCGANVSFMPNIQKFYCEYCGSKTEAFEFDKKHIYEENTQFLTNYDEYLCSTCGAKLIANETTTITDCLYCGSRQILKSKFKGEFNPVEIIPFKIGRNQFLAQYTSFIKEKKYVPKNFKNKTRLMQTKGVYVPFNLFFFDTDIYARGKAKKKFEEDYVCYKYFETEFSMRLLAPIDSSNKFDDKIMAAIEPFDYRELKKFNPVYLNGFLAEKGNEDMELLERKAENRVIEETLDYIKEKNEYFEMASGKWQGNFKKLESRYVLLPVWFVNTRYKNKLYTFAMNGQTGKVVGDVPINIIKSTIGEMTWEIIICMGMFLFFVIAVFGVMPFSEPSNNLNFNFETLTIFLGAIFLPFALTLITIFFDKKNLKVVTRNPIQKWNIKDKKYILYKNNQYENKFGKEELKTMNKQLFRNGTNVKELKRSVKCNNDNEV